MGGPSYLSPLLPRTGFQDTMHKQSPAPGFLASVTTSLATAAASSIGADKCDGVAKKEQHRQGLRWCPDTLRYGPHQELLWRKSTTRITNGRKPGIWFPRFDTSPAIRIVSVKPLPAYCSTPDWILSLHSGSCIHTR